MSLFDQVTENIIRGEEYEAQGNPLGLTVISNAFSGLTLNEFKEVFPQVKEWLIGRNELDYEFVYMNFPITVADTLESWLYIISQELNIDL